MKRILSLALVLCMVLSLVPAVTAEETGMTQTEAEAAVTELNANSDFYYELVDNYTDPDIEYQTEVRWWLAEGYHTDETLEEEIQAMYDAGFRGVELCQLNEGSISAADYGYGSEQWNHDLHVILNKCLDLGMTVGTTSGAHWGTANVPGLDPDSQAANQCIMYNIENVAAGSSRTGALPLSNVRSKANFIGAYAFQNGAAPIYVDQRYIQTTEMPSNPTTFTIESDFIVDKNSCALCIGMTDTNNFIMWQINPVHKSGYTYCRPHLQINGSWSGTSDYDITSAVGYAGTEILGKTIHMKLEVLDGTMVNAYFNGSDTAAFTYDVPSNWGTLSLNKLGFRANTDYRDGCEEIYRFDNLVVTDADGKVIYENTFDDPENPGFEGRNIQVVDGMLRLGVDQVPVELRTEIDPETIIDLTDKVVLNDDGRTGTLEWTAPEDGSYSIMYYWQQGTANDYPPAVTTSYTINYFDERGLEALKEYWTANVLNDPELNAKIKEGDVQLFMDSLEYHDGAGFTMWPENFDEEFMARKGYDIKPYIFLSIGLPALWDWNPNSDMQGAYKLTDADLQQRVLNDLYDVQTELYMEEFMEPFKEWLNSYGIKLRAQISYGKYLENSEPIQVVDYPEAENRNQGNEPDLYRTWTGGAHLQNKILSSETGGLDSSAYAYSYQTHLQEAYIEYAVGFSRQIWHIWSAVYGPTQSWPGYEGGMSQYYKFGTREPSYTEYIEFNNHLGRIQQLLREGTAGVDVGMPYIQYGQKLSISSNKHALSHDTMFFPSEELQNNGYSYDYFSPDFLTADGVTYDAENGTLELAGYKAIVLWQDEMTKDGAEALLNYAKQGLKIVVVDGAAIATPYNDGSEEAMLAAMEELKQQASVMTVATADDVLEALQAMGVVPYAGYAEPNQQLLGQVRRDGDNRYLYLYNYCGEQAHDSDDVSHGDTITTEIVMDGTFQPYQIDAWSGEIIPLANYRHKDGKTVFEVSLDYGDVALYAFEAVEERSVYIVDTDMDAVYYDGDQVMLRAAESGTHTILLSDGTQRGTTVTVPEPYEITNWDLTVESWTPGEVVSRTEQLEGSDLVTTEYAVTTEKTELSVHLEKLTTWDQITDIGQNVSGKGYYSATFNWDGEADGAYLDFGTIVESMQVFINGEKTADVNMNYPVVDISDQLKVGKNTIELQYSSNLTNVQLSRSASGTSYGARIHGWVGDGYVVDYRAYGPMQATIIPYIEQTIEETSEVNWFYLSDFSPMENVTTGWDQTDYLAINAGITEDVAELYLCTEKATSAANAVKYSKGMSIQAPGKITYDISDMNATRFTCLYGVNAKHASGLGSVGLKIYTDLNAAGEYLYCLNSAEDAARLGVESYPIGQYDKAVKIDIEIPKGATMLCLEPTNGGDGNDSDHAVFAEPKLYADYTYLSNMEYTEVSAGWGNVCLDKSFEGPITFNTLYKGSSDGVTRVCSVECDEGICIHAPSTVTYNIEGMGVERFTSFCGISNNSGDHNPTSTFKVFFDGVEVHSINKTRNDANIAVGENIDLQVPEGTKTITLTAQAVGGNDGNHTCWAYPRLFGDNLDKTNVAGIYQNGQWIASYASVNEAIESYESGIIKLHQNSDEAVAISTDLTIDLAGYTLSNVTVSAGSLKLVDSAATYEAAAGSAAVTGTVETFTEANGKTYLVVGENGVYAAHPYDVALTHISLNPAKDALGYKAKLYGDEIVQSYVENFGFNMWVDGGQVRTYGKTGTDVLTLRLQNILAANGGEMNINATTFVALAVGEESFTKTSTQQSTTMKQTLQAVDSAWASYSDAQKAAVKTLCDQYYDTVSDWELSNIYSVTEDTE